MNVETFLKLADQFKLGALTTESLHPMTLNLSDKVKSNLQEAISDLKAVDVLALSKLESKLEKLVELHAKCQATLRANKKIFLCGCGATGRLALTIEFLFRQKFQDNKFNKFNKEMQDDQVIAFMAGGDFALIKSVESFEDRMSYGARQLQELGFSEGDLLLAITEGGETSFVIGAALEAAKLSSNPPYFLYCNPDEELMHIERSREVLVNPNIKKYNLTIGPMALSGSTRMQASTVQMFVVGMAILTPAVKAADLLKKCHAAITRLKELDYSKLEKFIEWEASVYSAGGLVTYRVDQKLAISLLTDTTERSPTFSLVPFEQNQQSKKEYCLCYLAVAHTHDSMSSWEQVLGRAPRGLNWPGLEQSVGPEQIYAFDISENAIKRRSRPNHHVINVTLKDHSLKLKFNENIIEMPMGECLLTTHLCLKLLLNTHSTLVMGKLDRYQSNMMTWVSASNYKLVDRAARYVMALAEQKNKKLKYEDVVEKIFEMKKLSGLEEQGHDREKNPQAIVVTVLEKML